MFHNPPSIGFQSFLHLPDLSGLKDPSLLGHFVLRTCCLDYLSVSRHQPCGSSYSTPVQRGSILLKRAKANSELLYSCCSGCEYNYVDAHLAVIHGTNEYFSGTLIWRLVHGGSRKCVMNSLNPFSLLFQIRGNSSLPWKKCGCVSLSTQYCVSCKQSISSVNSSGWRSLVPRSDRAILSTSIFPPLCNSFTFCSTQIIM